ncbi:MFS transporter [Bordetella sp. LUAb4]|uniref:MFS transporter n=1 Tax=Bordetella sp. LUAb4 TaxID=2843195 RepID=UPI002102E3C7|nr:MFS transporter [Bordetella sp. LUAb4]
MSTSTSTSTSASTTSATRRTAAAPAAGLLPLVTLAIGFVMAILDVTVVNVALTDIAKQLAVPLAGLVWVVDGYTLTFAAMLLAGGGLADRYGAKTLYLSGLAVFVLASVLCGLAPSGTSLVAARFLQGLGAALFMPSSLSLLAHAYPDETVRQRMLGLWSAIVSVAAASGPLVGGILIDRFGWRSIFLINVPLGLVGLILAGKVITPMARHPKIINFLSHGCGMTALGALSYLLIQGPVEGWLSAPILGAAALTVLAAGAFILHERRSAEPLLPRALFETPRFGAANLLGFLINFGGFGQLFLLSLFLQQARHATPLQAGIQLLPTIAVYTVGNLAVPNLVGRFGPRRTLLVSMISSTVFAALTTLVLRPDTAYWIFALLLALANLGMGVAVPVMTATVMQVAGRVHSNVAAASLNANRQIGVLVGVAFMGTILHGQSDWGVALPIAFGAITVVYLAGVGLVWRYLSPVTTTGH